MKKASCALALLLVAFVLLAGCEKPLKPDSPLNTAMLLNGVATNGGDGGNYVMFKSYFSEVAQTKVTKRMMGVLQEARGSSPVTTFTNYELLTYPNGSMVLVRMTPEIKGTVYAEDIIPVPEEMKDLFQANAELK
ncbi:hypothetical protein [Gorillibacterium massiliense]|uniref:hypothetical protein n=1 Tax=Gorillibacterium massiliense TaxID=1280390 RepID=UPI0004B49206|nr:hypothetical protein [Gorillibacterium massiliense]